MKTLDIVRVKDPRASYSHINKDALAMIVHTSHHHDQPDLVSHAIEFIQEEGNGIAWFDEDELVYVTSVSELVDRGAE